MPIRQMADLRPAACCPPLVSKNLGEHDAETAATLFKALSDPTRVRIVNLIARAGVLCVCDVTPQTGVSQATVSFHLKKLTAAGLLDREQRGTWAYYSINAEALRRLGTVFSQGGAS